MRYEVAVRTNLVFHTQERPFALGAFPEAETVVVEFEGRRFVWHALGQNADGEDLWPVVTTMVDDPADYAAERLATERFLSALSFWTSHAIEVVSSGGSGGAREMDRPILNALRRGLGDHLYDAPREVVVVDDDRLRRVLAYYREGENIDSPLYEFLAFWNALDVACEDFAGRLPGWIRARAPQYAGLRGGNEPPPADWWDHLQDERRSAVAHAVRDPGRGGDLDPDDLDDRAKLARDARWLRELVRIRIRERWGDHPVWQRRRQAD